MTIKSQKGLPLTTTLQLGDFPLGSPQSRAVKAPHRLGLLTYDTSEDPTLSRHLKCNRNFVVVAAVGKWESRSDSQARRASVFSTAFSPPHLL